VNDPLIILKAMACVGIFYRLFTYKWSSGARYRVSITTCAYLMMFCAGAEALSIFMGIEQHTSIYAVVLLWSMFLLICAAKGNLARVLSVSDSQSSRGFSGTDRRKK
jgi:hypothetical protein